MAFTGWTADDFAVFEVEGFEARMALIRERVQPKLDALGRDLLPLLERETGTEWFHHVAKHMRRTVNPPGDTWVAFNRVKKGYKATVHFDCGISAAGANAAVVVKPECAERDVFAGSLARNASSVAAAYRGDGEMAVGDVPNAPWASLAPASKLGPKGWRAEADRLLRVKASEFEAGFRLPAEQAALMAGPDFVGWALERMRRLMPLYLGGVERGYRLAKVAPGPAQP